jgi:hypothetical protein
VLVLGPALSSIAVNAALLPVGRNHQRTIRASVMSPAEFDALLAGQDSFAMALVSRPMIVVKGSFDHGRPDAGADCNPGAEARSA